MATLTRWLAIGQLGLVAATWKLWTPQTVFPQIPLIRAACDAPAWCDWGCLLVYVTASLCQLIVGRHPVITRVASGGVAISLAGFFILDQHRLQPWAWQFFLLAILLSLGDDVTVRRGWIWLAISIYFWSAVSKLDYTFFHEQGPALLAGLKRAMGLKGLPGRLTESLDIAGSVGIAVGELGVAFLLAWPRSRWLGLWGAIIMHVTLLAALGPLGLNHSAGVLLWNAFFIGQDWLLFRPNKRRGSSDTTAILPAQSLRQRLYAAKWHNGASLGVIMFAVFWPTLEPIGLCDHWLAWAVYSARPERTEILLHPDSNVEHTTFPAKTDFFAFMWNDAASLSLSHPLIVRNLLLSQWSLEKLKVPLYPQPRFHVGIAWHLIERHQFSGDIKLSRPKRRLDGKPFGEDLDILVAPSRTNELERLSQTYFWNCRPRVIRTEVANPID